MKITKPEIEHMETYKGYKILMILNPNYDGGVFRCGYVEMHNPVKHYDEYPYGVHGGLTFSGTLSIDNTDYENWLGFDCNHYNDSSEVQDKAYVLIECKNLIDQILSMGGEEE